MHKFKAEHIAIIDHHPQENFDVEQCRIQTHLGSCATLAWCMLLEEGYPVSDNVNLCTALYYGLYTDTNQFSELFNPMDMDMKDELTYNKGLFGQFRNSNLSLKELEIAGIAMIRYNYNTDYHFAVIKAQPCDPNILGLISDFLLQVEEIDTCVVYNEINDGFKLSVRSCIREVNANELVIYLTEGVGTGGGHREKAGGFISQRMFEEQFPGLHSEAYFNNRMTDYFEEYTLIIAKEQEIDLSQMQLYKRRKDVICYIKLTDIAEENQRISLRSESSVLDIIVDAEKYFVIERSGVLRMIPQERFEKYMRPLEGEMPKDYYNKPDSLPTVKNWTDGNSSPLSDYIRLCQPTEEFCIYAKELEQCVKVFPKWSDENYMKGMKGDYLAASEDDIHNIFIESGSDFLEKFQLVSN